MKDFAPVAQRYLKHVAKVNGLEKKDDLADWKLIWTAPLNPEVTIDDAYDFGHEVSRTFGARILSGSCCYQEERWVDFAATVVVRILVVMRRIHIVHPYILMSWTGRLSDVYTLIHEIGHSGQFIFSDNHQSYFNAHMSTYYVEAPSTFNELLLSDYLNTNLTTHVRKRFALITV